MPADDARLAFRAALTAELGKRVFAAMDAGHLPEQDIAVAAPALTGALIEGLIGPLASDPRDDAGTRDAVQTLTLFALRAARRRRRAVRAGWWCRRGCRRGRGWGEDRIVSTSLAPHPASRLKPWAR